MFKPQTIFASAALVSAAFVAVVALAQPSATAAGAKDESRMAGYADGFDSRWSGTSVAATPSTAARKAAKSVAAEKACEHHPWPFIPFECVLGADVAPRDAVRSVTIERRPGDNVSVLVRVPVQEVASR